MLVFSVTTVCPPGDSGLGGLTWGVELMLAGLGVLGALSRRRAGKAAVNATVQGA